MGFLLCVVFIAISLLCWTFLFSAKRESTANEAIETFLKMNPPISIIIIPEFPELRNELQSDRFQGFFLDEEQPNRFNKADAVWIWLRNWEEILEIPSAELIAPYVIQVLENEVEEPSMIELGLELSGAGTVVFVFALETEGKGTIGCAANAIYITLNKSVTDISECGG